MRTTVDKVIELLDEATVDEDIVESILESASVFVTAQLSSKITNLSLLTEIERWVAAHMVASTRERVSKEEGAGGAYIKYIGEWGKGLDGTSHGQMAIMLDTTGTLAALVQRKGQASMKAIPNFDK